MNTEPATEFAVDKQLQAPFSSKKAFNPHDPSAVLAPMPITALCAIHFFSSLPEQWFIKHKSLFTSLLTQVEVFRRHNRVSVALAQFRTRIGPCIVPAGTRAHRRARGKEFRVARAAGAAFGRDDVRTGDTRAILCFSVRSFTLAHVL